MKKLFIACMMSMGALTMAAQDTRAVLAFTVPEMVGTDQEIVANVEYLEIDPGSAPLESFQWEVRPVTPDGVVEEPIFSETFSGSPVGEFRFPESLTASLTRETKYQLILTATDVNRDFITAFPKELYYSNYVLTGPKEICCGDILKVNGSYSGLMAYTLGMTHQWVMYECDAAGNILNPTPAYNSGVQNGYPFGTFGFPSGAVACDRYYRVQVTFSPSNDPYMPRPVTRYIIVHVTSFQLTAQNNYCAGQYMYAAGRYCQGINSPPVYNHQWQMFQSNAAGAILSGNVIPLIPLGGAPYGASEVIIGTNTLAAGYYILRLDFLNGSNVIQGSAQQLVVINPTPQAAITASASCGVLGANATPTGAGYTYTWSAFNGNTPYNPINAYGSAMSAGPGAVNKAKVVVTNQYGCSSTAVATVSNPIPNVSGDFTITFYSVSANEYYIKVNRVGNNSLTGLYDIFSVKEDYASVFSYKTCWTSATPNWGSNIILHGYDGLSNWGSMACNANPNYPNGRFYKDKNYSIEHYMTYNGCSYPVNKKFNWTNGVWGTYRIGENGDLEPVAETPGEFDVFPNPNNGSFTMALTEEVANAQVEVINVLGEQVDAFTFSGSSYSYAPAEALAPGIYLLRLTNNGTQTTKRIIVQ